MHVIPYTYMDYASIVKPLNKDTLVLSFSTCGDFPLLDIQNFCGGGGLGTRLVGGYDNTFLGQVIESQLS